MNRIRKQRAQWLIAAGAVAIFLSGPGKLSAQETVEKAARGCVWKLSDGDNTVYLAGSVHMLRETDYPLPSVYDLAYAGSDEVIFEIDMADLTSIKGIMEMRRLGTLPEDESLTDHLGKATFDEVVAYFESRKENASASQMSAPVIDRMTPGMIFLMISAIESQEFGARPELGLETQYFKRTKRDDKPTSGLETIAYQMSRFDSFSDEEIEALILKTLEELDRMPKVIGDIIDSWHSGEVEKLDKLLNEEMAEGERLRELLLTERNANWIPEIEKALEGSENVMVLVGSAHLIGKGSVIDMLRKKGYTVERVLSEKAEPSKPAEPKKAA